MNWPSPGWPQPDDPEPDPGPEPDDRPRIQEAINRAHETGQNQVVVPLGAIFPTGCTNVHHDAISCLHAGLDRDGTRDQMCGSCQEAASAPLRALVIKWRQDGAQLRYRGEILDLEADNLAEHVTRTYPRSRP